MAIGVGGKGVSLTGGRNDERDAADLADLMRMGRLPEAWIAPPQVRGLRETIRHRCRLVALRTGLKAQVHAVLAKQGVRVAVSDLFGVAGQTCSMSWSWTRRSTPGSARCSGWSTRSLSSSTFSPKHTSVQLDTHPGFQAIQAIRGVGPALAAIFVAEIGDVAPFPRPEQLCSWAGMASKHRESDTKVHPGRITNRATICSGGPRSKPSKPSATDRSGSSGCGSANATARTSARSQPPVSSSRSCSTACATDTSVAWTDRREHQSRRSQARGRSLSGRPPRARSSFLLDPAWLRP
jgi:hypothetical protein